MGGDTFIRPHPPSLDVLALYCCESIEGEDGGAGHSGGGAGHAGGRDGGSARGTTSYCTRVGLEKEMSLITFTYSCQI